jgi:RHS repeat-associated protein
MRESTAFEGGALLQESKKSAGEMGHRIAKHIYSYNSGYVLDRSTYYLLDAQGNTMSTYEYVVDTEMESVAFAQTEKHIYGSSRLGVHGQNLPMFGSQNATYSMEYVAHRIGERTYELSNHLGNVLSIISDKPLSLEEYEVHNWVADIRHSQDYSPFGAATAHWRFTLHGRDLSLSTTGNKPYRYGFQNQEEDSETGLVNYTFRMLNSHLGKFLSLDPLSNKYPWNSPYAFSENRVIDGIDLEGLEHYYTADGKYMGQIGTSSECRKLNSKADEIHVRNALYKQLRGSTKAYAKWYAYDMNSALKNSAPMNSHTLVAQMIKTSIANWENKPKEEFYLTELNASECPQQGSSSSSTNQTSPYNTNNAGTTNANDDVVSGVNDVMEQTYKQMASLFSTAVMDSKGKIHFMKPSGRVFTGNQYRSVSSLASYGRSFKYLARGSSFIGYYFDGKELKVAFILDGDQIGINTTRKVAGMAGKAAGSSCGTVVGAEIGSVAGPIGTVVGAGVGALVGGAIGENAGETAVDLLNSSGNENNITIPAGWLRNNQKVDNTGVGNNGGVGGL